MFRHVTWYVPALIIPTATGRSIGRRCVVYIGDNLVQLWPCSYQSFGIQSPLWAAAVFRLRSLEPPPPLGKLINPHPTIPWRHGHDPAIIIFISCHRLKISTWPIDVVTYWTRRPHSVHSIRFLTTMTGDFQVDRQTGHRQDNRVPERRRQKATPHIV